MNKTKICYSCHEELPLSSFWDDKGRKDGKYWICKDCAKKRDKRRLPPVPIKDLEGEVWLPIVGYEGLYEVSNKGRVKSLPRNIKNGSGEFVSYERLLVGGVSSGYRHYLLHKDGKRQDLRANRLVAMAFIPNPDNLPYVNHKDENKLNNRVENLEWCTAEYNVNYATAPERRRQNDGTIKAVCQYDMDGNFIAKHRSINDAKRAIGARQHSTIVQCCQKIRLSYKGFIWLYADDVNSLTMIVNQNKESNNFHRVLCINRATNERIQYNSIGEAIRQSRLTRAKIDKRLNNPEIDKEYIWKRI